MPNAHPLFVHFPIALLTIGFLFDVSGLIFNKRDLTRFAWWLQVIGTVALAITVITGLLAKASLGVPEMAAETFSTHQETALVAALLYAGLLLWRVARRGSLPEGSRTVFVILTLVALTILWTTAWYGGELVFRYGVGVTK